MEFDLKMSEGIRGNVYWDTISFGRHWIKYFPIENEMRIKVVVELKGEETLLGLSTKDLRLVIKDMQNIKKQSKLKKEEGDDEK